MRPPYFWEAPRLFVRQTKIAVRVPVAAVSVGSLISPWAPLYGGSLFVAGLILLVVLTGVRRFVVTTSYREAMVDRERIVTTLGHLREMSHPLEEVVVVYEERLREIDEVLAQPMYPPWQSRGLQTELRGYVVMLFVGLGALLLGHTYGHFSWATKILTIMGWPGFVIMGILLRHEIECVRYRDPRHAWKPVE